MSDTEKKGLFDLIGSKVTELADQGAEAFQNVTKSVGDLANKGKDAVVNAMDVNGDGVIDVEDFIIMGLRVPGVAINRESFLKAELKKHFDEDTIQKAIDTTPAKAGITVEEVDKLADNVISYERNCVTGISAALGMPGGAAMAATLPADIAQYYGFMLRACQKLLYLYGFPQINVMERESVFDSETLNMLTLCLGVMFGVAGANKALVAVANAFAIGVEKKLISKALTKGTIYPMVKKVAGWFGKHMTKKVFAGFFRKAIPVVGGLIGGGITYLSFGPCCEKLKDSLNDSILSNPNAPIIVDEDIDHIVIDSDDE